MQLIHSSVYGHSGFQFSPITHKAVIEVPCKMHAIIFLRSRIEVSHLIGVCFLLRNFQNVSRKIVPFTSPQEVYDASSSSKSLPVLGGSVFVISAIPVDVNSGISLWF